MAEVRLAAAEADRDAARAHLAVAVGALERAKDALLLVVDPEAAQLKDLRSLDADHAWDGARAALAETAAQAALGYMRALEGLGDLVRGAECCDGDDAKWTDECKAALAAVAEARAKLGGRQG